MNLTRRLAMALAVAAMTVAATGVAGCSGSDDSDGDGGGSPSTVGTTDDTVDVGIERLENDLDGTTGADGADGSGEPDDQEPPTPTTIEEDVQLSAATAVEPAEFIDDFGTDPTMDELSQRCFDGSALACDELYANSPLDDDSANATYEAYGGTCGGRIVFQRPAECLLR